MWQPDQKIKTHKCRLCLISKSGCCGQMFETLRWLRFICCMAFCLDNHTVDDAMSALLMYCRGDDICNFTITFLLMAQTVSSVMTMQPNHTECEGLLLSLMPADPSQITWKMIIAFTLFCISFNCIQLEVTDPKWSVLLFDAVCPAVSSLCGCPHPYMERSKLGLLQKTFQWPFYLNMCSPLWIFMVMLQFLQLIFHQKSSWCILTQYV